ncbi:MAG: carboxyvinyl-carboxyphosphonate phosphorylmutase [Nitrospinota bacterium]|nr:MAG: carboxyvinyl-carboxyphosphonate phosphorylmutase [Nitrospinota bacterium]
MKRTTAFRHLLTRPEILVMPGCYNAVTAKILAQVGFEAIYMSGYGVSVGLLGMPDVGLTTMTEMHTTARYIANAVSVPVLADADTGYGNAINVLRTVREYIQTGVAGIHIEDQVTPKRCGHVSGKMLIPLEEAVGKYRAADAARQELDPDFVLIARTDARNAVGGGLEEAIRRGNAYAQAGADVIFVEAPLSVEEIERVVKEIDAPILYNNTGISPRLSVEELQQLGVAAVIYPTLSLQATLRGVWDLAQDLKKRGTQAVLDFLAEMKGHPLEDQHRFAGFPEIRKLEEEFLPSEEVMRKYEASEGYQP